MCFNRHYATSCDASDDYVWWMNYLFARIACETAQYSCPLCTKYGDGNSSRTQPYGHTIFISFVGWSETDWVHLVRRPLIGLLYQHRMVCEYGGIWWNENWQGKPKYSEETAPVTFRPPQIPDDLTWHRTLITAVGSRRLTAWANARPTTALDVISQTEIVLPLNFSRRWIWREIFSGIEAVHFSEMSVNFSHNIWLYTPEGSSNTHAHSSHGYTGFEDDGGWVVLYCAKRDRTIRLRCCESFPFVLF
jgi:hypothetical protein